MGIRFRKSIKIGGLRVNLSKKGVGFSSGIKGLRWGVDAKGRHYFRAGRGGFFYAKTCGEGRQLARNALRGKCPACGVEFNAADSSVNTVRICKWCGHKFIFGPPAVTGSVLGCGGCLSGIVILFAVACFFALFSRRNEKGPMHIPDGPPALQAPVEIPKKVQESIRQTPVAAVPPPVESEPELKTPIEPAPAPVPEPMPAKLRTWHSASGGYSVEAEFVKFISGSVYLRTKDGRDITLSIEKLSSEDRAYIEKKRWAH